MIVRGVPPLIGRQYALGHDLIDSDHFAIADWWQRTVTCEPIQFSFFVARLKKLMCTHFVHEALLMQEAGGQMCGCHNQEHHMLLTLCDQATALGPARLKTAQAILRTKFRKMIREHIISMDQLTVLFINSRREIVELC